MNATRGSNDRPSVADGEEELEVGLKENNEEPFAITSFVRQLHPQRIRCE